MSFGPTDLEPSQRQYLPRNGSRRGRLALVLVMVVSLIVVAGGISFKRVSQTAIKKAVDLKETFSLEEAFNTKRRPVNILLLGIDRTYDRDGHPVPGAQRADTIMLLSMNSASKRASLISIPRDTKVDIPGYGTNKINAAHAIGGPELIMKTVEGLIGLPVDGYVETDFQGFVKLIDLVGGVTVNVDRDMKYRDRAGGLNINIKAGVRHLNGVQALQFVRFRHDAMGDISRVKRQQELLKAVVTSIAVPKNLIKARSLLKTAMECIRTDMSLRQVSVVGWFLTHMENGSVETVTLPGNFSPLYWQPDQAGISELVRSLSYAHPSDSGMPAADMSRSVPNSPPAGDSGN
ncbi:MAG TPA: LCP family protein [Firmicutes bacterium]|nr:LCP family protein [Bacillota bacterium]